MVTSTFRRSTCRRWLPPIERPSPSPVTTNTLRSGRASLRPVAMAGAPVDGVEAIGVHVVREAARAADARDEHDVFLGDAEIGHRLLHGAQDRVVTAPRAPAHVLVGLEILLGVARAVRRGLGGSLYRTHRPASTS